MEYLQCEFFLVRYVPDPVKNEFVNVGVILREASGGGRPSIRFTRDWRRVRCIDPEADVAALEALEIEVRKRFEDRSAGEKPILNVLEDTFSNSIQLTPGRGCLAENLITEMDKLARLYVESPRRETVSRQSGRQGILKKMRTEFERKEVWDLMRKRIMASPYTRPGDPLKIDCGYKPNGFLHMFHAVSLESDLDTAKVLAFSFAGLREGIRRVEKADLELTAIVEPLGAWKSADGEPDSERRAQYDFGWKTMESHEIRVLTTTALPGIAATARRELLGLID